MNLFINDLFFHKNLVQKSETTLKPLTIFHQSFFFLISMHLCKEQKKTKLAYLRQTLSYTHNELDNSRIDHEQKLLLSQTFSFHLKMSTLRPGCRPLVTNNTNVRMQNQLKVLFPSDLLSFFCSLINY